MKHLVNWIEIPVLDMARAKNFYSEILGGVDFADFPMDGDQQYSIFPAQDRHNNGALVQGPMYKPSQDGITIYLDGGDDMNKILNKVESAGGSVIMQKTDTQSEAGFIGMFIDTEGNKIGLQHS